MKESIFLSLACLLLVSSCEEPITGRYKASFPSLPAPELGESWGSKNEAQAEAILDEMSKAISRREANPDFTSRDAHPKAHGCPTAELSIDNSKLPVAQRVGIFSKNETHKAWVRFSNGAPAGGADLDKDIRGMAVKLMNVPGTPRGSQDFVMINAKNFFSSDGDDYAALFKALLADRKFFGNKFDLGLYALNPFNYRSVKNLMGARVQIGNSLAIPYHSSTIYKLGPKSMRFKMEPCSALPNVVPASADKDFLRGVLTEALSRGPACFNFYVALNQRPEKQPVEDPRISWDEAISPYVKVGALQIHQQKNVNTKVQRDFCENLSFDPWNSRPETRPLGQINRMRALIYKEISRQRHQENQTVVLEPRTHNPCAENKDLCKDPAR